MQPAEVPSSKPVASLDPNKTTLSPGQENAVIALLLSAVSCLGQNAERFLNKAGAIAVESEKITDAIAALKRILDDSQGKAVSGLHLLNKMFAKNATDSRLGMFPLMRAAALAQGKIPSSEGGMIPHLEYDANKADCQLPESGPYHELAREISLSFWSETLGLRKDTKDVGLIVDFFERRGQSAELKDRLSKFYEIQTERGDLSEEDLKHPAMQQYLGSAARQYQFKGLLREWEDQDFSYEEVVEKFKAKGWVLEDQEKALIEATLLQEEEEQPEKPKNLYKEFHLLARYVQTTSEEDETAQLCKPLYVDAASLVVNAENPIELLIWEGLQQGEFVKVIHEMRIYGERSIAFKNLCHVHDQLKDGKTLASMNQVLVEDMLATVIGGMLVADKVKEAKELLALAHLEKYKKHEKLVAAVSLAAEFVKQIPYQIDAGGQDYQDYNAAPELLQIARYFSEYLVGNRDTKQFCDIFDPAKTELRESEVRLIENCGDLDLVAAVYEKTGRSAEIPGHIRAQFKELFKEQAAFKFLVDGSMILNFFKGEVIQKYVAQEVWATWVAEAIEGSDNNLLILELYLDPRVRPALKGKIDPNKLLATVLAEELDGTGDLINKELSLQHPGEISLLRRPLSTYKILDELRTDAPQDKLREFIAYLLAAGCDFSAGAKDYPISCSYEELANRGVTTYKKPDYFPSSYRDLLSAQIEILGKIVEREKRLGGLDQQLVSTAIGNVIFRGNFVIQGRFYPHTDVMLKLLRSPLAEFLPKTGAGAAAIQDFRFLNEFLSTQARPLSSSGLAQ